LLINSTDAIRMLWRGRKFIARVFQTEITLLPRQLSRCGKKLQTY
jgi:hypothetical protein